jgi:hypothetical protein
VGDLLRRRDAPFVVVRVAEDLGDRWRVEPASEWAAVGMKVGAAMSGQGAEPCLMKEDGNWEAAPGP